MSREISKVTRQELHLPQTSAAATRSDTSGSQQDLKHFPIQQSTPTVEAITEPPYAPQQHRLVHTSAGFLQTTPNPSPTPFNISNNLAAFVNSTTGAQFSGAHKSSVLGRRGSGQEWASVLSTPASTSYCAPKTQTPAAHVAYVSVQSSPCNLSQKAESSSVCKSAYNETPTAVYTSLNRDYYGPNPTEFSAATLPSDLVYRRRTGEIAAPVPPLPPMPPNGGMHQYRLQNSASSYYSTRSTSASSSSACNAAVSGIGGGATNGNVSDGKRRTQTTVTSLTSKSQSVVDLTASSPSKQMPVRRRAPTNSKRRTNHVQIDLSVVPDDAAATGKPYCDGEGHYMFKDHEKFASRYRLESLLGQGTFGRVFRAVDETSDQKLAIKVIRNIPKYREASKLEIRALRMLQAADAAQQHRCIQLLRAFDFRNHVCMVFELLPSSIFDFLRSNKFYPFPLEQMQHFAFQLIDSVCFIHELKLVHTDLKPENIMLKSTASKPKLAVSNTSEALSGLAPRSIAGDADDGVTKGKRKRRATAKNELSVKRTKEGAAGTAEAAASGKIRKELLCTDIQLIDFGSAVFETDYHSAVVSTRHYRAPEILLKQAWSYPCDMWSVGCILVELFTGQTLFQTHDNLEHLAIIEKILGAIPLALCEKCSPETAMQFFAGQPEPYRIAFPGPETSKESQNFVTSTKPLFQLLLHYAKHQPIVYSKVVRKGTERELSTLDVVRILYDLTQKLLLIDPNVRITAKEALNHEFFSIKFEA